MTSDIFMEHFDENDYTSFSKQPLDWWKDTPYSLRDVILMNGVISASNNDKIHTCGVILLLCMC